MSPVAHVPGPDETTRSRSRPARGALALLLALAAAFCGDKASPSSPTTSTTTTTTTTSAAPPANTEQFAGTLAPGGSGFFSFTVSQFGTVNLTLTRVGGSGGVASTVWIGLGLGTPVAEDCSTTTSINTQAGSTAQITGSFAAGVYCAKVYDIGNLAAPASFNVTIEYP